MLRLLTDEQISPAVARQAPGRCRGLRILAMQSWEGGQFLSAADELVLREAHRQKLTLVTFELRTLPPLLRQWAEQGMDHSGVILVDEQTLAPNDIGGLVAALCAVWKARGDLDWKNRVIFLRAPVGCGSQSGTNGLAGVRRSRSACGGSSSSPAALRR